MDGVLGPVVQYNPNHPLTVLVPFVFCTTLASQKYIKYKDLAFDDLLCAQGCPGPIGPPGPLGPTGRNVQESVFALLKQQKSEKRAQVAAQKAYLKYARRGDDHGRYAKKNKSRFK
jgi:hypothetical protein